MKVEEAAVPPLAGLAKSVAGIFWITSLPFPCLASLGIGDVQRDSGKLRRTELCGRYNRRRLPASHPRARHLAGFFSVVVALKLSLVHVWDGIRERGTE